MADGQEEPTGGSDAKAGAFGVTFGIDHGLPLPREVEPKRFLRLQSTKVDRIPKSITS